MDMADEICQYFGLLRSYLPAFILIGKDKHNIRLYSIHDYNDFEAFLTPLNVLHSYTEDKERVLKQFQYSRQAGIVTQQEADRRKQIRQSWNDAIQLLQRKQTREETLGLHKKAEARKAEIIKFKNKLNEFPSLEVKGLNESIPYPNNELSQIKTHAIQRLDVALNAHQGLSIINNIDSNRYQEALAEIWDLISSKKVRLSNILEAIRTEINNRGFDIFISCKSQDYAQAHKLYNYLKENGFNPFLANVTIKEVGVDQYTALIGEVLNVCESMIVFATDVNYLLTPYVYAEWNLFVNDINTGRKPTAKIINILSSDINTHNLPSWLRDKQCFTIESYKLDLLPFLKGEPTLIQLYKEFRLSCDILIDRTKSMRSEMTSRNIIKWTFDYIDRIQQDNRQIEYKLENLKLYQNIHVANSLKNDLTNLLHKYQIEFEDTINSIERERREEFYLWEKIRETPSAEFLKEYLNRFPEGKHAPEITSILNRKASSEEISYSPCHQHSTHPHRVSQHLKNGLLSLFRRKKTNIFSSIFAPAQIQPMKAFIVRVYLYKPEESDAVDAKVRDIDPKAKKKEYKTLDIPVKKGDKLTVQLKMSDGVSLDSDSKTMVWHNHFTDCSFMAKVTDIFAENVYGTAYVLVNGIPAGEMLFTIDVVVTQAKNLYTKVEAHRYSRIFISYSHLDEVQVRGFAECCRALGTDYFFDRHTLRAGDIHKEKIMDYINNADLFILCWSKNAAESEWVQIERGHALTLIEEGKVKLAIYPLCLKPEAPLPLDMADKYHFGTL